MSKSKSRMPAIIVGIVLIMAVALFTGIAAYKISSHINAEADRAYAAALSDASMRQLAQSQTKKAAEVSRVDNIPVDVTVRINVVDERTNSDGAVNITVPDGYTVGDMVCINGEWFIIAKQNGSEGNNETTPDETKDNPVVDQTGENTDTTKEQGSTDSPDKITVNGETYVKVNDDGTIADPDETSDKDDKGSESGNTEDNPDDKESNGGESGEDADKPAEGTETGDGDKSGDNDKPENNEDPVGKTDDESHDVPYIGADYVTIDIDGNMVYLIKKGDTLTKISRLTGYSVQELAEFNHIKNPDLIYAGSSLRIPASPEAIEYVRALQNK